MGDNLNPLVAGLVEQYTLHSSGKPGYMMTALDNAVSGYESKSEEVYKLAQEAPEGTYKHERNMERYESLQELLRHTTQARAILLAKVEQGEGNAI